MICGKCNVAIDDFERVHCYKCDVDLHKACVEWEDRQDGNIIVCDKCRAKNVVEQPVELPIKLIPSEPSTSHIHSTEVNYGGLNRELICVLFPGIVKNVDKAIQCLGGIKGMSQVACQPQKRRLGLSYQPENPFVKKIYADYKKTAGVLLKIKVKKIRENGEVRRKVVSTNFVGRVNKIYRFDSMCDFQYLPIYREASGEPLKCLLDEILPSGEDDIDFIKGESPVFIVPTGFTRFDRPINYSYTDKRYPDRSNTPEGEDEFHNKMRSDRGKPLGHWWRFSYTGDFPDKPDECYIKIRDTKCEYNAMLWSEFDIVKKCFEQRPIWSLNRLRYETKLRLGSLKITVPCLAVFMKDGPWKSSWVKYGYDPRKEPAARIYQTLDFRLRHAAGVYSMVMTRDQVVHYKNADRVRLLKRKYRTPPPPCEEIGEGAVIFRPGIVPAQRQIFYQLCDVQLPEVESIVAAEPTRECHKKHGWLSPNAIEDCRDILFKAVKENLLATHNADFKFDVGDGGGSSDEESEGSGDEITNAMDETIQ